MKQIVGTPEADLLREAVGTGTGQSCRVDGALGLLPGQ